MAGRVPFDPFGDMLAGYRQADADNKQDLSFNAALEGAWIGNDAKRLQDLYNRDTYGLAVQMAQNQARQSAQRTAVGDAAHQGNIAAGKLSSLGQTGDYQTYFNNLAEINAQKQANLIAALKTAGYQSQYGPDATKQGLINQAHAGGVYIDRDKDNYAYDQQVRDAGLAAMIQGLNHTPSGVSLGLPPTVQQRVDYGPYLPPGVQLNPPTTLPATTTGAGSAQPAVSTTGSVVGGARAPNPQASNPQIANGPWGDAALAPTLPSNPQNVLASGLLGAYANTPTLLGTNIPTPSSWGKLLAEYLR